MSRFNVDFRQSKDIICSRSGSSNLGCPAAQLFQGAQQTPGTAALAGGWQQLYRERAEVERNWRTGQCTWKRLTGHRDYIRCAQLQGRFLATCSGSYMHRDCSIRLWDVETGTCLEHMQGHEGPIWSMHYEQRRISSCDDEGSVRLWDLDTHRVGVSSSLEPHSLKCLGQDSHQLAVAGEVGVLALWSLSAIQRALEDAEPLANLEATEAEEGGDAEVDGIAAGERRQHLPSWQSVDLESAGVRPSLAQLPQVPPGGLLLASQTGCLQIDGGLCATGNSGPAGQVHLWGTHNDKLHHHRTFHLPPTAGGVSTLSFQQSTGWLVAGCGSGLVLLWDLQRAELLRELLGHTADVLCHQQSGGMLATGSADRTVRLWDLRSGEREARHVLHLAAFPYSLQLDGWRLAVGCGNGTVQVADLRRAGDVGSKLALHAVLPAHGERVWALALSESRLISASLDSEIVVRSFHPADQDPGVMNGRLSGGDSARGGPSPSHSGGSDGDGSSGSDSGSDIGDSELDSAYASSSGPDELSSEEDSDID